MSPFDTGQTDRLLGYPADARLLLINADDFGMCHAVNEAILRALKEGIATSCSIMMPCPWALHALTQLQEAPTTAFGIHLTVISEQPLYRWGPLMDRGEVPSLLDESGYFYSESRMDEFLNQVDLEELEQEFRIQIERVLAAGLHPTHMDSHCSVHVRQESVFERTLRLAREYGLALRAYRQPFIERLQRQGYSTNDHPLMDSYDVAVDTKSARYAEMLRMLPAGLNEWAVHPGLDCAELRAVEPGWQVRSSDFEFVMSPEARAIIQEEGIVLVDYTQVQALWNAKAGK